MENHYNCIYLYINYNDLIKIWECVQYASNELKIDNSSICKCAKGKIKTAGGFKWKYIEKQKGE